MTGKGEDDRMQAECVFLPEPMTESKTKSDTKPGTGPNGKSTPVSKAAVFISALDREGAEAMLASLDKESASRLRGELLNLKQVSDAQYAGIAAELKSREPRPVFSLSELQKQTIDQLATIRARAEEFSANTKAEIERLRKEAELAIKTESARLLDQEAELDRKRAELEQQRKLLTEERKRLEEANYEETRHKGYTEGQRQGMTQGYQEGQEKAKQEHQQLVEEEVDRRLNEQENRCLPAMDAMVQELTDARARLLGHWEENILQIAAAIAYQTVLKELPNMPELPLSLLKEALEMAVGNTSLKVRMNPGDLKIIQPRVEHLLQNTRGLAGAELVADGKVSPGGCLVETSHGTIDERLESRLERIITELSRN